MKKPSRLLVIDDSATIRKLVELSFGPTEWSAEFAASGQAGVDSARAEPPDAILLDFVLPDMRGSDVCRLLSREPRTANVPVVVMSAKRDTVRVLFQGFPFVVDFIGKPFAANEVVACIRRVARPKEPSQAANRPLSFETKQAIAQAIYAKLRGKFAEIPKYLLELGNSPPATFFARMLLTPELIDDLCSDVAEQLSSHSLVPAEQETGEREFSGRFGQMPLLPLLELVSRSSESGALLLRAADWKLTLHLRGGSWCFATSNDPARAAASLQALPREPEGLWLRAEDEQRATEKPVLVTLAEAGVLPRGPIGPALSKQSRALLLEAVTSTSWQSFVFRPHVPVPRYAEGSCEPIHLPSIELARLRTQSDSAKVRTLAEQPEAVFERTLGFSRRVRAFVLDDLERRLLSVMDGETPLPVLAQRATLPLADVLACAARLCAVGLTRERAARLLPADVAAIVVDPDQESFAEPLCAMLREQAAVRRAIALSPEAALLDTIRNEMPRLVIVSSDCEQALPTAEAVRAEPTLSRVLLVAVQDAPCLEREARLALAGYDAILSKPVPFFELERLLSSDADQQQEEKRLDGDHFDHR